MPPKEHGSNTYAECQLLPDSTISCFPILRVRSQPTVDHLHCCCGGERQANWNRWLLCAFPVERRRNPLFGYTPFTSRYGPVNSAYGRIAQAKRSEFDMSFESPVEHISVRDA